MVVLRSGPTADGPNHADSSPSKAAADDSPARNSRSSSPAKRRADEMDGYNTADSSDRMELDQSTSALAKSIPDQGQHQDVESGVSSGTPASAQASSTVAADASSATTEVDDDPSIPSLDDQVKWVVEETMKDLEEEGFPGYIISKAWLGRVIARTKYDSEMGPFDKSCMEGEIGRVDNSAIISNEYTHNLKDEKGEPFVPLKKDLSSTTDLQILPKSAWDLIMRWYGLTPPQRPIIRYRHQVNPQDSEQPAEWQYELYPPVFTLRKLQMNKADPSKESPESAQDAPIVITARSQKYMDFIKIVKNLLAIPLQTKISIGRVLEIQSTSDSYSPAKNLLSMPSPPASRENSPARSSTPMIMTMDDFKKLHDQNQIDVVDVRDESMNENYNGKVNLDTLGLRVDQVLIIQEGANKAKGHMSDAQKKGIAKNLTVRDNASETSSGRASPAGGMMTRGRYRSQGRAKGTIGLTNLGNTCYMNSALQCMRACQELTLYFLGTTWKRELNTQNPLGHKGHIAQVYADLLHNIYDGSQYSYTPRQFKTTLGKFAPMFSGYGQQDSQEFMSFLVDGLHEDLNRILKKPYIENPESDDNTVNDPEAIRELGQKYREIYQARNSSVITDLFSGSYKNKLVCPVCNKISINFDPFLLLTLQLPLEHHWEFTFTFVPLKAKPYHIRIDNSKGATIRSLKEFVAGKIAGTTPSKLLMTEIFSQKLYRVMEDHTSLPEANIQTRDDMVIYELEDEPTNWPPPPKKFRSMLEVDAKDDTPPQKDVNERQLVMIQHRSVSQHSYSHNKSIVLWPTFITVTKEEASNYDEILRKILRAVSNQSHRDLDELVEIAARKTESDNTDSESPPEYVEGEMSVDEEKAGDSNVEAESLDDDDFVDVKMTNSDDSQQDSPPISTSQVPHWLEKGAPIPDILRKLFEVCAVQASDPLPTGYTQPDWNRAYSPIKERIPKPAPEPEESDKSGNSPEPIVDASEDDATEDADEQHNDDTSQMSIVESESESPPLIKPGSSRNRKNFRGGKKNKQQQKHGQKGRRNTPPKNIHKKTVPASQDTEHTSGDERLIRNNEMIILDWNPEAFHGLFESQRGGDTKKSMDLLEDVELDKRTEQRESRRKRGMNLEECFEETSKAEILTEDNAWYCPNCKERRLASKQLQLWTVPDILVIHLKRFSSGRGLRDKIDVLVDFPVEGLDLNGKVGVDEDKNLVYDLFAVDNHYGGLGGGHYTAFAKNFYDDEWYEYNDSSVTKRQAHTVVTPAAYLLFYRRRSTHPLGSPELQKIVDRAMSGGTPDFETESRSSSPDQHDSKSGNDRALDDLYPNGSSSALVGPVAARPLPRAGSVRAEPRTVGGDIFGALEDEDEDAADAPPALHEERLPMYGEHFSEVDEGIGMDDGEADDAEDYSLQSHNIHHPMPPPNWSFDNLSRPYGNQSYDDDQTSNVAADGDDEDEEYNASGGKMNEDFSYEEQHDGTFVHDDRRWTAQQVEESRKPPSSPVLAATAAEDHDEEEDIIPSVEVDMADAGERVKHE